MGEATFKDMYEELLLESRADQLAIEVAESQVDAGIENMKKNFGIENDEQFSAALAQSGITEAGLREQLRKNIRMRDVMSREVQSRIQVDEEDLRRVYRKNIEQFRQPEQLQLREIVVLEEGGVVRRGAAPGSRSRSARPWPAASRSPTRWRSTRPGARRATSSRSAGCPRATSTPVSKPRSGSCRPAP